MTGGWLPRAGHAAVLAGVLGVTSLIGAPGSAHPGPASGSPTASESTPTLGWAPTVERSAFGAGALRVAITSLMPSIPESGDTLAVRGSVTNVSDAEVSSVSLVLRVSPTPLPSRGEIEEILAGAGSRTGWAVPGTRVDLDGGLAPGAARAFAIRASIDDLDLRDPGAYMVGVQALGSTGGGVVGQDLERTFLPWWPAGTSAEPLLVTTLWPVTSMPQADLTGRVMSEEAAVEMSPGGRLESIVKAAAREPGSVTLVLDPATVLEAAAMSAGYEVLGAGGNASAGTRTQEVGEWLDGLRTAVKDPLADSVAMLYGMPDLVASRRSGLIGTLMDQRARVDAALARALGSRIPTGLALLPDGVATTGTLERLARSDVPGVVLSEDAFEPTDTFFTPSGTLELALGESTLPALVVDEGLARALDMPLGDQAGRTAARQRLLAETLTTTLELPAEPRLLIGAPDPQWSPTELGADMVTQVMSDTPWIEPLPLSQALARDPSTVERPLAQYRTEDRARELPALRVGQVGDQYRALAEYAGILADPGDLSLTARTAPSRGLSAWFRDHPVPGAHLADRITGQLGDALSSVTVVSQGVITVSGTSGTIPVTVGNLGPSTVTVGLLLRSDPPQLFTTDPIAPFDVQPGQRTSLAVNAHVAAAGPTTVEVQVVTKDGEDFGAPSTLTVSSSAYARAAGVLVRVALATLLLTVVIHGIRRARRRRRSGDGGATAPASSEEAEDSRG